MDNWLEYVAHYQHGAWPAHLHRLWCVSRCDGRYGSRHANRYDKWHGRGHEEHQDGSLQH